MLPPLPPPMPPWPGNPPWQQPAGEEARDSGGADPQQLLAYLLGHYHAVQSQLTAQQRAAAAQLPQLPAAQRASQAQQAPAHSQGAPQGQQAPPAMAGAQGAPPPQMKVQRTEPQRSTGQSITPVPPVAAVNVPPGARHRAYWYRQ